LAIVKERDSLKLEAEQLLNQCKETEGLRYLKNPLITEAKGLAGNIVAMEKERDIFNLETEQLRGQCNDAAH
jgi:hypothetical protein